jgi:hypothetical protein
MCQFALVLRVSSYSPVRHPSSLCSPRNESNENRRRGRPSKDDLSPGDPFAAPLLMLGQ